MLPRTRRPSATTCGMAPKSESEQDDLRDGAGRVAPGAHRHADVGFLQREGVVHPVADHRDGMAAVLEREDHRPLLGSATRGR